MTKSLLISLFSLISSSIFSQTDILDGYPNNQFFYEKGELNFLKDLHDVAIQNDLKPCKNKEEQYAPKWIVFPDRNIKFIKDSDSVNIQKNKCAYDFARSVFKYLDQWKPVIINQKSYPAIATYDINPSQIFLLKIKEDLTNNIEPAEYRGGQTAFWIGAQKLIGPVFDRHHLMLNGEVINLRFTISKAGMIEAVDLPEAVPFRIKDEILEAVKGMKKWKPAALNGIPQQQKVSASLRFGN